MTLPLLLRGIEALGRNRKINLLGEGEVASPQLGEIERFIVRGRKSPALERYWTRITKPNCDSSIAFL